ncbi:MBL fold metallo-hydrolase [Peptoniphilus sp. KCTC 25270]|uniref:MBL fold metallo-hydrolase n=1 Tax=Peptoniphilus sp. KCTC 25270 TaxID=2897414 RepID=UPI001E3EBCC9|nr:MBL fold metallo-hydrolase [Peptoniphilus sp. KCTC 25270]MCD1147036.1 MBL fold metallo-hydrolase [Peptoniphilus sp. KCTC 25270]
MKGLRILVCGATNAYVLYGENKKGLLFDPGGDANKIINEVKANGVEVEAILLTHAHGDHIGALNECRDAFNVKVYMHEEEQIMYNNKEYNMAHMMGMPQPNKPVDVLLQDGDTLDFDLGTIQVIHTPGHTPGSVCYLMDGVMVTGDTIFEGSIGRTDLPMGDWSRMEKSLKKIKEMDESIQLLPGHGESTTIGREKVQNPFLLQIL